MVSHTPLKGLTTMTKTIDTVNVYQNKVIHSGSLLHVLKDDAAVGKRVAEMIDAGLSNSAVRDIGDQLVLANLFPEDADEVCEKYSDGVTIEVGGTFFYLYTRRGHPRIGGNKTDNLETLIEWFNGEVELNVELN